MRPANSPSHAPRLIPILSSNSPPASITELERAVMMGGGELLERMGMKRGAWDGEFASRIDGIPGCNA